MRKIAVVVLMMLAVSYTHAQDKKQSTQEKKGDLTIVTYYHDNGKIQQKGAFNVKGNLHDEWMSFDNRGNKVMVGNYEDGKKVGKWFFWNGDSLKEVDYSNNVIVNINQWTNDNTSLASNN